MNAPATIHSAITVVQARMGSTRLPGKMMADLAGQPLIWHILQRAKSVIADGPVVLATTTGAADDVLAAEAKRCGVACVRGSEHNVLGRFLQALVAHPARWVVRVCGDSPLFDPDFLSHCLRVAEGSGADVVRFADDARTLFQGGEVVSAHALRFSERHAAADPLAYEHVTAWVMAQGDQWPRDLKTVLIEPDPTLLGDRKLSVDTASDLTRLQGLYDALYDGENIVDLRVAAAWLARAADERPED